jgi:hydrogenase nickel incorporation protein HypA/HybF
MHELAIADSVLQIVCRHAAGRLVAAVDLKVGQLRQVVPPALEFSFVLLATGTEAEDATLRMDVVEAGGRCRTCGADGPLGDFPLSCAGCGGLDVDVTRGEELYVDALELEEQEMTANGMVLHGD